VQGPPTTLDSADGVIRSPNGELRHFPPWVSAFGTGRGTSSITLRFTPRTMKSACVFTRLSWLRLEFLRGAKTSNRSE
jgi:hypothetical protein